MGSDLKISGMERSSGKREATGGNPVEKMRCSDAYGYFDDHDVLFKDSREQLRQCKESAELLILGYNQFAEEHGIEPINLVVVEEKTSRKMGEHLRTFATLARSQALVSAGKLLDAYEEILSLLNNEDLTTEIDRSGVVRI
jgi:hypothetical protein